MTRGTEGGREVERERKRRRKASQTRVSGQAGGEDPRRERGSGPTLSDSPLRLFRPLPLSLSARMWAANESESFSCTAVSREPDESSGAKLQLRSDAPPPAGNWCSALDSFFFPQKPTPTHSSPTSVSRPWRSHCTIQH